jgi:methylase of polypeptide subunit release factors
VKGLLQRAILGRRVGRLVLEQIDGLELVVLPDVFNPAVFRSSAMLGEAITANVPRGARLLDVGTGTGVGAIQAAIRGAHVTAIDVNPEAIRCARINALLNHADGGIELRCGDLFAPVAGERFDVVVCNPPFFQGTPTSPRDVAWRSEDFISRFSAGLEEVVAADGYALVVFSNHADERGFLDRLLAAGWRPAIDRSRNLGNEVITVYRVQRGARS